MNPETPIELEAIKNTLDIAGEFGIEADVIYFAMTFLKKHPEEGIVAALNYALDEWIK